jgi:hypothetical protein
MRRRRRFIYHGQAVVCSHGQTIWQVDDCCRLTFRRPCSRRWRPSGCRRHRVERSQLLQVRSSQKSLISSRSHASRARVTGVWVGRRWRSGIPAPKYPAFAAYLAQRSPKGSIFENRTQLCLSERPDPSMRRVVDRPTVALVPAGLRSPVFR